MYGNGEDQKRKIDMCHKRTYSQKRNVLHVLLLSLQSDTSQVLLAAVIYSQIKFYFEM